MRRTLIASTLAGLGLLAGAAVSAAQTTTTTGAPAPTTTTPATTAVTSVPAPVTTTVNPDRCVEYYQWNNQTSCLLWAPTSPQGAGSLGYGSAGTGSLSDMASKLVLAGSNALSLQVPIGTGSLQTPGSTGSYGPEAALGQLSVGSLSPLAQGSIGS